MAEAPATAPATPSFVPVCAIGASAGGVSALQTLFRLLPDDLGLAYVVVMHLAPDHPSAMDEILGAVTKMPVHQIDDGPTLRPNCVYVIAPDRELVIEGDQVKSRPFTDPRARRAPIDMFFRSIAAGRGDGIAVVLTGTGSDGAVGVRAIKEGGGIVMVQEPVEAGFPSMPQSAIATGVADVVAPLASLAERIAESARSKGAVRSLSADDAANDIRRIVAFLRTRTGHDFSGYKRSTVMRRIGRRMQVTQIMGVADYAQHLRDTPEEAKALFADLLITVTMFFRDPETFVTLTHRVIAPLLESRQAEEDAAEIRAWVVGCATGEEAYSLAILLLEEAERRKVDVPMQIFATDLDEGALATAREGRYPRSIEADVSAERLKRFFVDEETHYRVSSEVRDLVLFATHSVVREPPFMRLDLITCRNVLIYLERALQSHVCGIFHYGLKPDGFLFLGTAETADASKSQFAVVDRDARIYRALPAGPEFLPSLISVSPAYANRAAPAEARPSAARLDAGEILGAGHTAALEASAPPSALVNADHDVLHLSPTAGRFMLLSAGPLSGRLTSIVRPELRLDLKLALDRVFEDDQPTLTRLIDVPVEGEARRVSLHVAPVPTGESAAPRALVFFLDNGPARTSAEEEPALPLGDLQRLHSELKVAQEAEMAGRVRHESAMQELRASNEELQSLNEEYRSTAEELETSKEELQSINEELQTVNAELKSKLSVLSAAHNDLQNLTASSEIGTLFLDRALRIRMFTPRVADVINLTQTDIGRPITDFTHRLDHEGVAHDVRAVLAGQPPTEAEIRSFDGAWFMVRVRPYRTINGAMEGAVVTFDDITARKKGEAALRESQARYRTMFRAMNEGYVLADVIFDDHGRAVDIEYLEANPTATRLIGVDMVGRRLREIDPDYEEYWYEIFGRVAFTGESHRGVRYAKPSDIWYDYSVTKVDPSDHDSRRVAIRFFDATARVRAEAALRDSEARYQALFSASPVPFMVLAPDPPDFTITAANDAYFAATLTSPNSLIGRRLFDVFPDDPSRPGQLGSEALAISLDRVLKTRRTDAMERVRYDILTPEGGFEPHWWLAINAPMLDPSGQITAIIHQVDRQTELHYAEAAERRAQEALSESEARFRTLAETAPALIWRNNADGENVFVNRHFLDYTGLAAEEIGGERWRALVHPDDADDYIADYMAAVHEQRPFQNRNRIRRYDGAWRWFENYAQPLVDEQGRYAGHVGISTDVTAITEAERSLRESERWRQTLLEGVPQLVWRAVDGGQWTWASPQWTEYTGQAEPDSHGYGWLDPVHPDDRERAKTVWSGAVERGEFHADYRLCNLVERRYRWFQSRATPVRNDAGEIVEWLGTSTDVDDLRRLQDRQRVLLFELQHRVRNTLAVVRSLARSTAGTSATVDDFASHFEGRLNALARTQMVLTRSPGGGIDLETMVREELLAQAPNVEQVEIEGPSVRLSAKAAEVLALAVHELATNAVKYGALAAPGGAVEVRWSTTEAGGEPWLRFGWTERGVRVAGTAPRREGFGTELVTQRVPYELRGHGRLDLRPGGLHAEIAFPLRPGESTLQTHAPEG